MADNDTPTSRARLFKWLALLVAVAVVAAAVVLVFLPDLLPASAVRREVADLLSERLGRPVTVTSARLDWREGLTATGVRIARRDGQGPLAEVERLTVLFTPTEAAHAAAGSSAHLESLRFEGLELWLVLEKDGRLNVADFLESEPLDVGVIQVGGARVHFLNRRTDGRLDFENVHASVGELSGTGNGYVSLSADLCREPGKASEAVSGPQATKSRRCGRVVLTANLDRLHVGPEEMPVGSLKAEWSDLPWDRLWAAVAPASPVAGILRETSGRMSATVGRGTWSAEGAVQAGRLAWPAEGDGSPTNLLPEAILGFRLHRASSAWPVVLDMVTFSAPGLNLKVTGTVAPSSPASEKTAEGGAGQPRRLPALDLSADGTVTWGPLCQNAAPLRPLVETFDRLGGKARVTLEVKTAAEGLRVNGSADLSDSIMVADGRFEKQERDRLRLRLEGTCDRRFRTLSDALLDVEATGAHLRLKGTVPVGGLVDAVAGTGPDAQGAADGSGAPGPLSFLAGAQATATAEVQDTASVLALVPGLVRGLGSLEVRGPCRFECAFQPIGAGDGASAGSGRRPSAAEGWTAALRADLTGAALDLRVPGGSKKPAGILARLDADAALWPAVRRSDVRRLAVRLGESSVVWDGSARIDWPRKEDEQPVGRFEGTLTLEGLAKAGAILAPGRFEGAAPLAGGAVFDVAADLAEGRLRTHMEAGLGDMDLRLGRYLVKPAGGPASLALTSLWHTGRWKHVEGEADLDLPGVHLSALGQVTLVARWKEQPAAEDGEPAAGGAAEPAPRPRSSVDVTLAPKSTIEVKAEVSDLKRATALSPLLADVLTEKRADGRSQGRFVLSLRPDGLQATGELDLTETALDLGGLLTKPAGRVLRGRVAGDVVPRADGWLEVRLAPAEVHLGESVTRADGRVRLDWAGLVAPVKRSVRLAAALGDVDVTVKGDWRHGSALHGMLPWLAPLQERCGLEGTTTWTLTLAGTPTRGRMDLDLDATDCRVSAAAGRGARDEPVTVKDAGTPASARLKVRYGEVPGEMIVEDVQVHVAEATASASARLLFDNPRLLVLEAPDAWTLRLEADVPDAALLASLLPWRLADLEPTGAVAVNLEAAADARGTEVESCRLRFDAARIRWLGRDVRLDGPVVYDHERLATDGLALKVGGSDVHLVMYIARPNEDPTGSVVVRGRSLDLAEVQAMIRQTSKSLAPKGADGAAAGEAGKSGGPGRIGEGLRRLLARAHLSADVRLEHVSLVNPKWDARYDLVGLEAEGRLADRRLVMPRFACRLNHGTVTGRMQLDFGEDPPLLQVAYDARDLKMDENLEPFIDTTFPGMKVFGTLSTRATRTQRLAEGAHHVGEGETVLTDGLLEGPAAPDYMTAILPGLKLTRYEYNRMSNVFENRPDGVTDNRMLFDGKAYDLFIFGLSYPDGRTRYTMGVDLLLSLGAEVSRTLDQGKLPLMHYNGRIVGKAFAEREIAYFLPHEFAYEVFLKRSLLLNLIRSLGRPEPDIPKPDVVPMEERRPESGLAEPRSTEPRP